MFDGKDFFYLRLVDAYHHFADQNGTGAEPCDVCGKAA
jgi:hypothetical protein